MTTSDHGQGRPARKILAIIDDTPECERAVFYAAKRAHATGSALTLLYVIEPGDFQHWLGVEEVMRAEAREQAEARFAKFAKLAREKADVDPELIIAEGQPVDQIHNLIEEDHAILLMILAAGAAKDGPGPLVSAVAGRNAAFPIPVTVVPATMSDENIAALY